MTTGEKIRAARKQAHLTQKQLGELCGIAEPTIRRYELGKLNPKKETLEKIAVQLGVYYLDLYGDKESKEVADFLKEGMRLGAKAASAVDRMAILAEYREKGYQFTDDEARLVSAYNKMIDTAQWQFLSMAESIASNPKFSFESSNKRKVNRDGPSDDD